MPKYVVVDSKNVWLEFGEYNTPEKALVGGLQSGDFDEPSEIFVYEVVNEHTFKLDLNSGKYAGY